MKVFMSWSGQRSKLTAELLEVWIKCVIQAAQPWISSKGIERGALWFTEINDQLKDTAVGVVCLTQENKSAPWILFETGALAKGLSSSRVCTFLVDVEPADLQPPLAQFNHTFPTKESMKSLVTTLNNGVEANRLDPIILDRIFETYWPQFEQGFAKIIQENPVNTVIEPREEKDMLSEILSTMRGMANRVRDLEEQSYAKRRVNHKEKGRSLTIGEAFSSHSIGSVVSRLNKSSALDIAVDALKNGATKVDVIGELMLLAGYSHSQATEIAEEAMLNLKIEGI